MHRIDQIALFVGYAALAVVLVMIAAREVYWNHKRKTALSAPMFNPRDEANAPKHPRPQSKP